jgi:tRNA pseudouridine55 synthase
MNGIIVLDKPAGPTSHDVVDEIRRLVPGSKVGHAGTLDPNATGVLVVMLGRATRVSRFLIGLDKEYLFTVQLGLETDTLDRWGRVIREGAADDVSPADIMAAASRFRGRYQQIAPSVSAIKHRGVPLYKMARRGQPTPIKTRLVVIKDFDVIDICLPFITIRTRCSSGTYVRSLARDMGSYLGCGASVFGLRRLAVGSFSIERATPLADLSEGRTRLEEVLLSIEESLKHLPRVHMTRSGARRVRLGAQPEIVDLVEGVPEFKGDYVTLVDEDGALVGIARRSEHSGRSLMTERLF